MDCKIKTREPIGLNRKMTLTKPLGHDEISAQLATFLHDNIVAPDVTVTPTTELSMIGIDSFSLMELVLFIERRYELVLPPETLTPENIATVEALSQLCMIQLNQRDG